MTKQHLNTNKAATAAPIFPSTFMGCINDCKSIVYKISNSLKTKTKRAFALLLMLFMLAPLAARAQNRDCNGPIAITADAPYTEGFESPQGTAPEANGPLPDCWEAYDVNGNVLPHNTSGNAFSGSQSLSIRFSTLNVMGTFAFLPEFSTPLHQLQISFNIRAENTNEFSFGGLTLGYITAEDDGTCNTFTKIETISFVSSWEQHTTLLSALPSTAQRLVFKATGYNIIFFIDDVEITTNSVDCFTVVSLNVDDITFNSVLLGWELLDDSQTAWDVQVATDADFTENVTNLEATTHENYPLGGLDAGTQYYVRVRAVCDDTHQSEWSDAYLFTTQCEPFAITADMPYTQGFESPEGTAWNEAGPLPDCWEAYTENGVVLPHNTTSNAFSGSQSLSLYPYYSFGINGYVGYALLPEFSNPLQQLQIRFYLSAETTSITNINGSIALGYITAEDDGTCNTFTAIETYEYTFSSWEQRTTMLWLVPTAAQRLVFKAEGYNVIFYVDDLEVSVLSVDCYPVYNLSVDNVTTTSASLDWELRDESQTEWNVQVATNANFTKNLTHYVADIHENFALGNLSPSTRYYVRVRPSCSETLWSSTLDFLTTCGPITITADAPYFEDFQNYAPSAFPDCWEAYTTGATAPGVFSLLGSKYLRFTDNSFAILPEFTNPLSELQVSFNMRRNYDRLHVGYITAEDDGTCNTFTAVATYGITSSSVHITTYMFNVPATAQRLVFKYDNLNGSLCEIDDVEVAVVPLGFCYPVKALSLGEVFHNAAYLSWELIDNSQTEWAVQVATDVYFTENVANYVADSHENFLIDGLTCNTTYYVRVKPACSEGQWSDLNNSFTTLCGYDITLETPYTEGFESPQGVGAINYGLNGPLPACWEAHTTSETNAIDPYIFNDPNFPVYHEGSQCLTFDIKNNSYAILPEFSNPLNELQISFWMKIITYSGSINIVQLSLGYITAEDDGTCNTFTEIESYTQANDWEQRTLALDNVPVEAHRLAFRWSDASRKSECFVDDVEVSINPALVPPHDIAAGNITQETADITWEGLCGSYAMRYRQATESSWTTPDDATLADHFHRLTSLEPGTTYELQMKSNCTGYDGWSETITFTTLDGSGKYFLDEGDWCEADNWMPAGLPTLADDIYLFANATVPSGCVAEANSINVNGNSLTIEDGGQLNTNAQVYVTIKKNVTGYGAENAETNNGYVLLGPPITSRIIYPGSLEGTGLRAGTYDLYTWDRTADLEWINYGPSNPNTLTIYCGIGFLYANQDDTEITYRDYIYPHNGRSIVYYTEPTVENPFSDWNLIANGYMCNTYLVDAATNGTILPYYRMNAAGNGLVAVADGAAIAPMEGIFYQAPSHNSWSYVYFVKTPPATQANLLSIDLVEGSASAERGGVSTGSTTAPVDRAIIRFDEGSTLEKFSFGESTSKIYIPQGGKDYAVATIGGRDAARHVSTNEMPLNFKAAKNGTYTLSVNVENMEFDYLHLIDNLTGADVDLLAASAPELVVPEASRRVEGPNVSVAGASTSSATSYTFTAKTTDYASRFRLVFSTSADETSANRPFAYVSDGNIIINDADARGASLQVVDMMGRIVHCGDARHCVSTQGMTAGVYVLRLISGDEVKTQKIVVK